MAEWIYEIINDVRKPGREGKTARKQTYVCTVIFLSIIVALVYFQGHFGVFFDNMNTLIIPLCEQEMRINEDYSYLKITDFQRLANYDADIQIDVPNDVGIEDGVTFGLKIVDTGIIDLEEPYYFIFLVNVDENKVVAGFPYMYEYRQTMPTCRVPSQDMSSHIKWTDWNYRDSQKKIFGVPQVDEDSGLLNLMLREDLMGIGSHNIQYRFDKIDKEGPWEIWVYLFEDVPKSRDGTNINNIDDYPVQIKKTRFIARHSEKTLPNPFVILSFTGQLFGLLFVCYSVIYSLLKRRWAEIVSSWRDNKYTYLIVVAFLLVTVILSFALCNC